jgi:GalNAc-alpha-(1->4)-GalNAc-alpha-(1->3)-diNAcBac-PP-undecaprenol alpha-1,4-N-acetyl-D-galactosaminyltransferase
VRILFLTSSLGAGGAERVATTLCNAWAARGDHVILMPTFSGGGKPFYKVSESVCLQYLADLVGSTSKSPFSYFKRLLVLRKTIVRKKPDVVISFLPNVNVAAILSTRFLNIPVVSCERRDPSSQPTSRIWEFACRKTYQFADMLVVQTEVVANTIGQLYPNLKKVRTVANPLPNEIFLIKKQSVVNTRKILLSLGRLTDEKQVSIIISAFSKLVLDYPDWHLHIYGDGPARVQLEGLVHSHGLQHCVFLMGRTSSPWIIMADADAFVMTSKYEGFPNALLESMGVGLPCVTFDCPSGPKDITLNGGIASLVPLGDQEMLVNKLSKVMGDEALRTQMGESARSSVMERYSLSSVLATWDKLFQELGILR